MKLKLHHLGYILNMALVGIQRLFEMSKAIVFRLGKLAFHLETWRTKPILTRTEDCYLFCRPRSLGLYTACCHELYELEKWFKPLAKGVVVDVGAYMGTYAVRACRNAERVIAIELLPYNFVMLKKNIELNRCAGKAILVNKAVGSVRRVAYMKIPKIKDYVSYTRASLK